MPLSKDLHPPPEVMEAFAAGRLSSADRASVRRHVSNCPVCTGTIVHASAEQRTAWPSRVGPSAQGAPFDASEVPEALANHPRYQLVRRLGAGGMGVVYQAVHRLMERDVALKVINADLTRQAEAVRRFLLEMKAAARLHHPNIVTAHDAEQVGELHVLVLELVDGVSLDRFVKKKGPLAAELACHFMRQAALGLQHAHEQGMVHRDVKPQNLMVTRKGQVKILDFGLARLVEGDTVPGGGEGRLTYIGQVMGTPDYIAPEQVSNSRVVDARADIYSLGCTLYHLLAGHPPFPGGAPLERAASHLHKPVPPLGKLRPDLPEDLLAVIGRMMAKSPDRRYQTAGEVARDLASVTRPTPPPVPVLEPTDAPALALPPVAPSRPRPLRPRRPRTGRRRSRLALAAVGLGLLLAFGAGAVFAIKALNRLARAPAGTPTAKSARPKVLLVVPRRDFWASEYAKLCAELRSASAEVVVASSAPGAALPAPPGSPLAVELPLIKARACDYAAIIFVSGGPMNEFVSAPLPRSHAKALIDDALREGKVLAALSNGAAVLGRAGALKGKMVTGDAGVVGLLEECGATVLDEDLVADGKIITARTEGEGALLVRKVLAAIPAGR